MYERDRNTRTFLVSMHEFFDVAERDMERKGVTKISCPCRECKNLKMYERKSGTLHMHLVRWGFMEGYTRWTSHGEEADVVADEVGGHEDCEEEMDGLR